jgi:4-carboxymuconolactone decarboxylase
MSDDRAARGKKIRDEAFGKDGLKTWDEFDAIAPTHARAIHEYCFGTIWDRPHLDLKTRELIVIAAAVASDCPNEVALHARGALNRGAKREEIIETILQCAPYVGFPKTSPRVQGGEGCVRPLGEQEGRLEGVVTARLRGLSGEHLEQQIERRHAERTHVGNAIAAAGLERDRALDGTGLGCPYNGEAAMPGRVAVAIASRAGGATLGQGPSRGEALPRGLRQQPRIGLGRGAHAERLEVPDIHQRLPRHLGIDDGPAEEVGRRSGHCQERRRNEAAGRGFRNNDRFAPLLQETARLLRG